MAIYYRGFSTVSSSSQRKFVLNDNALIKQDLTNALMTRQGSRVMYPNQGCIAWNKLFNNINDTDIAEISYNITQIVGQDPRVNLLSIDIAPSINNLGSTSANTYSQLAATAVFINNSTNFTILDTQLNLLNLI